MGTVHQTQGKSTTHGLPLTLLAAPEAADAFVLEMGMNHAGEIDQEIGAPNVRIITNVGAAHLRDSVPPRRWPQPRVRCSTAPVQATPST